jgi:hypothetical protein
MIAANRKEPRTMQTDSTFLDALTQRGVLLSVSVRYWRA